MHNLPPHLPMAIRALAPVVAAHGYVAVGGLLLLENFGLPVPGETVLIVGAVFSGFGQLNVIAVGVVAFVACIAGDSLAFAVGEYGGHPVVERYGRYLFLTPKRIARVEAFFNRYGGRVVVVARFIDGLRQLNGIIAGLSEMRWPRFLTYNALGAALWVSCWVSVGYFASSHVETLLRFELYLTVAAVVGILAYCLFRLHRRRRRNSP